MIPDFTEIAWANAAAPRIRRRRGGALAHPEGIAVKPAYGPADIAGLSPCRHLPRPAAVRAGAVPDDVRHAAVDDPAIRGFLSRRPRIRTLSTGATSRRGRRASPSPSISRRTALRLGPPPRRGRRRHGGRGDRLDPRHADAVRPHPLDRMSVSMTMNGAVLPDPGTLHRGGGGAGRAGGQALRHDPERHPQGVHGPQHLHLPAQGLDADHRRHLRLHREGDAEVQFDSISPAITCRRRARRRTSSSPTRSPTAWSNIRAGMAAGLDVDAFAPRLSFFFAIA